MTDKEIAKEAYLKGYEQGTDIEELKDIHVKTAKRQFEQWWELNHSE